MFSKAPTVSAYPQSLPLERRKALAQLRKMIRAAAPKARESLQYGMAAYDLHGLLFAMAAQKNNLALYLTETKLVKAFRHRMAAARREKAPA